MEGCPLRIAAFLCPQSRDGWSAWAIAVEQGQQVGRRADLE